MVWSSGTLAYGWYTVHIEFTGTQNIRAGSNAIKIDAVDVTRKLW